MYVHQPLVYVPFINSITSYNSSVLRSTDRIFISKPVLKLGRFMSIKWIVVFSYFAGYQKLLKTFNNIISFRKL